MTRRKITEAEVAAMIAKVVKLSQSPTEMAKMDREAAEFDVFMDKEYQANKALLALEPYQVHDFDLDPMPAPESSAPAPSPKPVLTGTKKITIRMPNRLLAAYKAKAKRTGTRHQTLMVRTLKTASLDWDT